MKWKRRKFGIPGVVEYIIYTEFPGFVMVRRYDKIGLKNYQPQWEREKKQFRSVDPYGKPLPRELIRVRKPVPLWRSYHPIPRR